MRTFTEFFGFYQDPFKRTPDVEFYYPTHMHLEALDTLTYLIHSDEPFAVLTGEPGTGKTITIKKFINELPENIVSAYILFPNLTPEELFMAILEDFNIPVDKELTKNTLFAKLRDFLIEIGSQGKKAVIIIDEAQNLPNETLEELRLLSNLETEKDKLLKIILAGQPELDDKLNEENLRQLKQRVTLYVKLHNIKNDDIKAYIYSHLEKAGKSNIKIHNGVVRKIAKVTKGNPRLINTLMERTIIAAYLDNSHTITEEHFTSALSSINHVLPTYKKRHRMKGRSLMVATVIAVLAVLTGYLGVDKIMQGIQKPVTYVYQHIEAAKSDEVIKETVENAKIIHMVTDNENNTAMEVAKNIKNNQPSQMAEVEKVENNIQEEHQPEVQKDELSESQTAENMQTAENAGNNQNNVEVAASENTNTNTNTTNNNTQMDKPVSDNGLFTELQTPAPIKEVQPEKPKARDVYILVNSLNVRSTPNLGAARLTALKMGQKFEFIQENDEWVEIRLSPTQTGWVFKQYVSITDR